MATTATDLDGRLTELKQAARARGYSETLDFRTDRGDAACAAVAWAIDRGAPTARALLLALPDGALGDTAAEDVLAFAWQAPTEGAAEPVGAMVDAGGGTRFFDLDPFGPHEIDQLPAPAQLSELKRLSREPTFEWSLKVYELLQRGFDDFHERVYSTVRDTIDGKNDIIDETAKFLFLELFRLRHKPAEKRFEHDGQTYTIDEVFRWEAFEGLDKKLGAEAVERVKAAFEASKGHKNYVTVADDGARIPIFTADVHLKLSNPTNYGALIRLLQDLPPLHDNRGRDLSEKGKRKATLADVAGDVLGRAFDVFLRHKFVKEGVGIYLTPAPVKRAMVDLALHDIEAEDYGKLTARDAKGRPTFRVGDPAGGTAGFPVTLLPQLRRLIFEGLGGLTDSERETLWAGFLEHSFVVADSSPRMVRLARLNLALQGAPRARVFNLENSLTSSTLEPESLDLILTNPPFGTPQAKKPEEQKAVAELMAHFRDDVNFDSGRGKGGVLCASPSGLAMGAAPDGKGVWKPKDKGVDLSVLFLDRCLQLLKPGGRLLMVVPDSLLCNKDTRYVREYLMGKQDATTKEFHGGKAIVKAVISLPGDTFKLSGTGAKTSILYVQKRKADPKDPARFVDEPQTEVFMAVADTLGYAVKNNQEVYVEDGRFIPNDLVPIVGAYRRGE
jgi:type I restriction enzyme M protein